MANVEHSVLTGSDLHEPKGIAAAVANRVYVSNGAASGSWTTVPAAGITAAGVLVFQGQLYHIRDERASGTDGDTFSGSTWNTRALNTERTDDLTITTASNQIPLVAGTYWIQAETGTYFAGSTENGGNNFIENKLRLRNVTDSTTLLVGLSQKFRHNDDAGGNRQSVELTLNSTLSGRFTLGGTKSIELQNWIVNGLSATALAIVTKGGKAASSGEAEVYTDVKIWKIS